MGRLAVAFVLVLSLSGCILGRARDEIPLDPEKVKQIQPGKTTKREVTELLGAPTYVNDRIGFRVAAGKNPNMAVPGPVVDEVIRSPLDHSYTYEHADTKSASLYLLLVSFTNTETKRDRVTVFFDEKGVVSHLGVSLNAKDAEFRLSVSD